MRSPLSPTLADAIRLIDGVHRDGQVNRIRLDVAPTNLFGFLEIENLLPARIVIDPDNDHVALTVTHEIGHFIEWAGIPKANPGFRNFETDPLLQDWLDAVVASQAVQHLGKLFSSLTESHPDYRGLAYVTSAEELWARCYCQYIQSKSGSTQLLEQMNRANKQLKGTMTYPVFWKASDFVLIADAIDRLFSGLEWIS